MPLSKTGAKVKRNMEKTYGKKKGEQVFYATANSPKQGGKGKVGGKRIEKKS